MLLSLECEVGSSGTATGSGRSSGSDNRPRGTHHVVGKAVDSDAIGCCANHVGTHDIQQSPTTRGKSGDLTTFVSGVLHPLFLFAVGYNLASSMVNAENSDAAIGGAQNLFL